MTVAEWLQNPELLVNCIHLSHYMLSLSQVLLKESTNDVFMISVCLFLRCTFQCDNYAVEVMKDLYQVFQGNAPPHETTLFIGSWEYVIPFCPNQQNYWIRMSLCTTWLMPELSLVKINEILAPILVTVIFCDSCIVFEFVTSLEDCCSLLYH